MSAKSIKNFLRNTLVWQKLRIIIRGFEVRKELRRIAADPQYNKPRKLLVINHYFHGELKAFNAVKDSFPELAILSVLPEPFFTAQAYLFPEEIRSAREPYDAPQYAAEREESRRLSLKLYEQLQEAYPFEALVSPADDFYWLREFILVCQEHGKKVFIVDKEGTISPQSYEVLPEMSRKYFPPISDYYLVWGERQKKLWSLRGADESKVHVTGSARSDIFVNLEHKPPKNVIFFDFDVDAYINVIDFSELDCKCEPTWIPLRDAFRRAACRIAEMFPEIQVIIKCHPQQLSCDFEAGMLEKLSNLKIVCGAEISELYTESYAAVGFQTTALLETALARIPTFYCAWGELYESIADKMLPFHDDGYGMRVCRSEDEIVSGVRNAIENGGNLSAPDSSKLSFYFHNADGQCAKRIISMILQMSSGQ